MRTLHASLVVLSLAGGGCSHLDRIDELKSQQGEKSCAVSIDEPEPGLALTDLDDVDLDTPGMQLRVAATLTGTCSAVSVGEACGTRGDQTVTEMGRQLFTATVTQTGDTELCLSAFGEGETSVATVTVRYTPCTDSDADHCGMGCEACPDASNGAGVCRAGECAVECDDGFELDEGACRARPSCSGLRAACSGDNCCAADLVSENGKNLSFRRGWDASSNGTGVRGWQLASSRSVSIDPFYIDRYEVTVGRFRRFIDNYDAWHETNPRSDAGRLPTAEGSGWNPLWRTMNASDQFLGRIPVLPAKASDLRQRVKACGQGKLSSWTDEPGENEDRPINCVTFWEAYLFCLADHPLGRLPTEAEWNAAAAGGGQQRAYPWSSPPEASGMPTEEQAYFGGGETSLPVAVGSKPAGAGAFGTHDLAGNVFEWVRDAIAFSDDDSLYVAASSNPVDLTDDDKEAARRVLRGGSFKCGPTSSLPVEFLRSSARVTLDPMSRIGDVGFRCARSATE